VWIWEQTAIISLYSINWLVCITETECLLRGTDWIFIYRQFNIQQFHVLPTHNIYVFCVDLRTNSDYFPIQHLLTGLYNRDGMFTARYETESLYSIIQILAISGIIQQNAPLSDVIHGAKFISRGGTPQFVQLELAALSLAHKKRSNTVACLPDLLPVNAIRTANIRYTSQLCAVNSNPRPALIARALIRKSPVWIPAQLQATRYKCCGTSIVYLERSYEWRSDNGTSSPCFTPL